MAFILYFTMTKKAKGLVSQKLCQKKKCSKLARYTPAVGNFDGNSYIRGVININKFKVSRQYYSVLAYLMLEVCYS
jgi:hypothetical protein